MKAADRALNISEQAQLQNAATLLSSNLFKLQVEELLNEVDREKTYTHRQLKEWIETFSNQLKASTASAVSSGLLPASLTQDWAVQLPSVDDWVPALVASISGSAPFCPIDELQLIGSFAMETITHPFINVDIAFTIPDSCINRYLLVLSRSINHSYCIN
jgi:hypothetical protein